MKYDLIIIGSGPAGYVAGIRAGQIGLKTAIIEKNNIGGMCLNWGCIPTKTLIESAKVLNQIQNSAEFGIEGLDPKSIRLNWNKVQKRFVRIVRRLTKGIEYLLKKNGVEMIMGEAILKSANSVVVEKQLLETENIIIATGSKPKLLPNKVKSTSIQEFLTLTDLPQKPIIIGSNAHAVELAQFFNLSGVNVKLLIQSKTVLPEADEFLSEFLVKLFKQNKIELIFETEIKKFEAGIVFTNQGDYQTDCLINASDRVGIIPKSEIDIEEVEDFIKVNGLLQTNHNSIFAVGDVNGRSKFAHTASAQGLHAVNVISGIKKNFEYSKFPINIYTNPEIAQIGMTEAEIKREKIDYKISEFPLSANGKAMIEGQREGQIRMLSDRKYGEVLGVQIIANNATDLIAEAGVLMQLEGTVFDVANTIHAHPTISEIYMESGFDAFEQPIHK